MIGKIHQQTFSWIFVYSDDNQIRARRYVAVRLSGRGVNDDDLSYHGAEHPFHTLCVNFSRSEHGISRTCRGNDQKYTIQDNSHAVFTRAGEPAEAGRTVNVWVTVPSSNWTVRVCSPTLRVWRYAGLSVSRRLPLAAVIYLFFLFRFLFLTLDLSECSEQLVRNRDATLGAVFQNGDPFIGNQEADRKIL